MKEGKECDLNYHNKFNAVNFSFVFLQDLLMAREAISGTLERVFHPISKLLEVGLKQPRPCIVFFKSSSRCLEVTLNTLSLV